MKEYFLRFMFSTLFNHIFLHSLTGTELGGWVRNKSSTNAFDNSTHSNNTESVDSGSRSKIRDCLEDVSVCSLTRK